MVQRKYFGDRFDYFKYDLITEVLKNLEIHSYVFVPMLTCHRDDNEGKKRPYCADQSSELLKFINNCNDISLAHWESWLKSRDDKLIYQTVQPVNRTFFDNSGRLQYWSKFDQFLKLEHSLLFIDPDTGIETGRRSKIKTKDKEKYILSCEVEILINTISTSSILMIYQHLQFDSRKRESDIIRKVRLLNDITQGISACSYREGNIAFLFISKSNNTYGRLYSCLESYYIKSNHPQKLLYPVKLLSDFNSNGQSS